MRLLLITNVFPNPYQPTKGVFNLELVRALAREHDIRVVAPLAWVDECRGRWNNPGVLGPDRRADFEGVEVHCPTYWYPPKILRAHYGWFFWRSIGPLVARLLANNPPDAVLGYWAHPDGEAAVRAARQAGVPAVVMVGGTDVLLLTRDRRRRRCIARILEQAAAVVAVSEDIKGQLERAGIALQKVHVVPRGVDRARFSPGDRSESRRRLGIPEDARMFLWVGRMVPVKGLDVLVEACARLAARGVEHRVYLVGDGPLRSSLEAAVAARRLSQIVTFVGPVGHDGLADWYRAADWTVLPSRSEGIPNVLRESLACGTPFVASRVGGIPEIANDVDRLVAAGDPEALAGALAAPNSPLGSRDRLPDWDDSADRLLRILGPLASVRPAVRQASVLRSAYEQSIA